MRKGILFLAMLIPTGLLPASAQSAPKFRALLYDISPVGAAYVHTSAIAALKDSLPAWGREYGFAVDVGADASVMTPANLAKYQTIIFDNVSSETADALPQASQRAALLDYMQTGGFLGIHAAAEAGRWPDLVAILGAKMTIHTSETNELSATLNMDAGVADHPLITGMTATGSRIPMPARISLKDEWYSYTASPRNVTGVKILYGLDEKTFTPAAAMGDHPIAWIRDMPGGGRMFYTGMGHSAPYLSAPFIKSLLINSLFWTAKMETATGIGAGGFPGNGQERFFGIQRRSAGHLTISIRMRGGHRVQLLSMDGKVMASRNGYGPQAYEFAMPGFGGLYLVKVETASWRGSKLLGGIGL